MSVTSVLMCGVAAVLFAGILLLVGCAWQYPTPILAPHFSAAGTAAAGAVEHTKGVLNFMKDDPSAQYRVLMVHGMGTQDETYADTWVKHMGAALSLQEKSRDSSAVPFHFNPDPADPTKTVPGDMLPKIKRYVFDPGASNQNDVRVYAVLWSPLTTPFKNNIQAVDSPAGLDLRRAAANKWLKTTLMDDRISDAVMYAGEYRATIHQAVRQAFCNAVLDTGDGMNTAAGCSLPATSTLTAANTRVIIYTHSLGSKIVLDVLTELLTDPASKDQFGAYLAGGVQFYMFADQLPLLDLADVTYPSAAPATAPVSPLAAGQTQSPPRRTVRKFLDAIDAAPRPSRGLRHENRPDDVKSLQTGKGDVQVVAFSDPNDVLSYLVPNTGPERFFNVIVSNAPTYFGALEWPDTAHLGYYVNDKVWNVVANGISANAK